MLGTDCHRCDDISNFPQIPMKRYRQFYGYYNAVITKKHALASMLPGVRGMRRGYREGGIMRIPL